MFFFHSAEHKHSRTHAHTFGGVRVGGTGGPRGGGGGVVRWTLHWPAGTFTTSSDGAGAQPTCPKMCARSSPKQNGRYQPHENFSQLKMTNIARGFQGRKGRGREGPAGGDVCVNAVWIFIYQHCFVDRLTDNNTKSSVFGMNCKIFMKDGGYMREHDASTVMAEVRCSRPRASPSRIEGQEGSAYVFGASNHQQLLNTKRVVCVHQDNASQTHVLADQTPSDYQTHLIMQLDISGLSNISLPPLCLLNFAAMYRV